jgi:hypothetical protein
MITLYPQVPRLTEPKVETINCWANYGKGLKRTCCPPTPFSHFWYLTEVKPRFSAMTRSSSFKDARSARAVIWAYLLYLNGWLASRFKQGCATTHVNSVLQAVIVINGVGKWKRLNTNDSEQLPQLSVASCD